MKVKIISKENATDKPVIEKLLDELRQYGIKVEGHHMDDEKPSLIFVIGGDGTMLNAVMEYQNLNLPFIGINTGTLGFLMNERADKVDKMIKKIISCDYEVVHYPLFEAKLHCTDGRKYVRNFICDLVIERKNMSLTEMEVIINGIALNYFAGDGYIVSSPVGSTAYSIWAGGAAIHHALHCIEIVPMHPNDSARNLPMKLPLILPDETEINFRILNPRDRGIRAAVDGYEISTSAPICEASVKISEKNVTFWNTADYNYLHRLKKKIIDKERIRKV